MAARISIVLCLVLMTIGAALVASPADARAVGGGGGGGAFPPPPGGCSGSAGGRLCCPAARRRHYDRCNHWRWEARRHSSGEVECAEPARRHPQANGAGRPRPPAPLLEIDRGRGCCRHAMEASYTYPAVLALRMALEVARTSIILL
jgi:hypothetical protein